MRTSFPPSAHVLVVCGPTAAAPSYTPYNLSFHLSCSRGHAAPPGGRAGPTLRDGPMVCTLRRLARSRGPRAACNRNSYGRPVARSRGLVLWRAERHQRPWGQTCAPDFCSRSCMKMLHRPEVCINRSVRQVPGPGVCKAWQGALAGLFPVKRTPNTRFRVPG